MNMSDFSNHDAVSLAELVRTRQVTPLELVDAAIERIERHNPALNAVVHTAFDEARAAAKGALPDGPFKGVPFLIKDLGQRVKGWPRTSASFYAEVASDAEDSELVRRYRAAGLVLAGKTNTPEFGIPGVTHSERLGACRNPWNPDHVSGGSSGGAAAAVASGMVPIAHASDPDLGGVLLSRRQEADPRPQPEWRRGHRPRHWPLGRSCRLAHRPRQRRHAGCDGLSRTRQSLRLSVQGASLS
jgi:Asp-tRNA(Asn)/Glu-tRNA(Gln) amidotransferase A subunit family amidase